MTPFLKQLVDYIHQHHHDATNKLTVVIPSQRNKLFIINYFKEVYHKTIWLPKIFTIDEFVSELSGLKQIDNTELLFSLYNEYQKVLDDKAESFDNFIKWGSLILKDFNEVDQYLIDTTQLYTNLKNIKEIENWSLNEFNLTDIQEKHIAFMSQMATFYNNLKLKLLEKKIGYQGLIYREAANKIHQFSFNQVSNQIIFCGFNALNKAEEVIITTLVNKNIAKIFWDYDTYYFNNKHHEAGYFLRQYFNKGLIKLSNHDKSNFDSNFKDIQIIAAPKKMAQAQAVSMQINTWLTQGVLQKDIAVVLNDETMLTPILSLMPSNVKHLNITMQYPLKKTTAFNFFDIIFKLHVNKKQQTTKIYFEDFFALLKHRFFELYFNSCNPIHTTQVIVNKCINNKINWLNTESIKLLFDADYVHAKSIFQHYINTSDLLQFIQSLALKIYNHQNITPIEKSSLQIILHCFKKIEASVDTHPFLSDSKSIQSLFYHFVSTESIPFIGEPLQGIQIMGVLESRNLDFKNIIMVSCNEAILPKSRNNQSFIPYDLKRYFGMPLHQDKDAMYAYHFYKLLQRANNVALIFNSEKDKFGSEEKSRFLLQLEHELKFCSVQHQISHKTISQQHFNSSKKNKIEIIKSNDNIKNIQAKICNNSEYTGLSPSSLLTLKQCQLKFYLQYEIGLKEYKKITDDIEPDLFGNLLHKSLELLYKPFLNATITYQQILSLKNNLLQQIENAYNQISPTLLKKSGKFYLQKEVIVQYVTKQINADANYFKNNTNTKLIYLEHTLSATLVNNNQTFYFKGTIDRIDKNDNTLRVIDYKSSIAPSDKFTFNTIEELFIDVDCNKMFQLFFYAWLVYKNKLEEPENILPGIIPFSKFMDTPKKIQTKLDAKLLPFVFTKDIFDKFEIELQKTVNIILDKSIPFTQTQNNNNCIYCSYQTICNI